LPNSVKNYGKFAETSFIRQDMSKMTVWAKFVCIFPKNPPKLTYSQHSGKTHQKTKDS